MPDGSEAGTQTDLPWSAWQELRVAVQKSPDCLAAQAEALVLAKDPEAIFAFVRDRIAVYPPRYLDPLANSVRWGTRATLRGGGGTARERAELLAELYRKAGFSAEVVVGWREGLLADDAGLWASYARIPDRPFDPLISNERLDALLVQLGRTVRTQPVEIIDDQGIQSRALADALLAALPPSFATDVEPFLPALPKDVYIPLVRVTVGGQARYANPLHPDAEFGQAYAANPVAAEPMVKPVGVSVSVSVSTSQDPTLRSVVASASYEPADLVGRQLVIRFAPLAGPRELAAMKLGDPTAFVPVLAVTGMDLDAADAEALTHTGTIVTVGGDQIVAEPGKPVTVNGVEVEPDAAPDAAAAAISALSVTALAQTFPQVELRVSCTDAAGKPVDGLKPGSLTVSDAAKRVRYLMRQNRSSAPRVAFVIDQTLSQPTAFLDSTARRALGVSIGQKLFATFPGALVQVTALSGQRMTRDGYLATDAQGLGAAFATSFGTSQPIYTDLAAAIDTSPSLVVFFSDGIVTETPGEVAVGRGLLARGVPVIAVGTAVDTATINHATMQELAALSGGTAVDGGDFSNSEPVLNALGAAFAKLRAEPVALSYTAAVLDPGQHEVVVQAANGVSAKTTYTVPAAAERSRPRALAGIHLSVKVGDREVVRTLAGWSSSNRPAAGGSVPEALLNDVRGMLLGTALISFEAGAPSIGTWLDDALGARLSLRPAVEAVQRGDVDGVSAAVERGVPGGLERLSLLHAPPLFSNETLSFEQGLRTVLLVTAPRFGAPATFRSDVLGHAALTSLAKDPATALRATLETSLRVALGESAAYQESTIALLAGKTLVALPPNAMTPDAMTFAPEAERAAWSAAIAPYYLRQNVVPEGGGPVAFFSIDQRTGEVLAVLGDGSGGGKNSSGNDGAFEKAFYDILKLLLATFEIPGLGFVLAFGKFVVAAANLANSCFNGGDPTGADPLGDLGSDLAGEGLGSLGKAVGGGFGAATDAYGKANDGWDAAKAAGTILGGSK